MAEKSVLEQIAKKSGKQAGEIEDLVEEKKKKFSGLLTDSGASFMVAKDLGIELGLESVKRINIAALKDGMQNVDLLVRVMKIFSPKEFEKNGKRGTLCNLIIADSTGEARFTVWHDDVEKIAKKGVKRGSILLLHNCYAKEFNGKVQTSLAYKGRFEVNPDAIFADLPEAKSKIVKAGELAEGMNDVSIVARVLRIFPATEFDRNGKKGKVMNFLIGDETGTVRATAWNDLVEEAQKLAEGEAVSIDEGYTKPGLKEVELHLGWQARISKVDETGLPSSEEIRKGSATRKKIIELKQGDSNVLVEGKIITVNKGALFYNVCPKCGGKVHRLDEGIVCDKCGEVKEPDIREVISVRIDDGSAQVDAVAYGKEAEKIIGLSNKELKKQRSERGSESMIEELQELNGTKIRIVGKVKQSNYSNQPELVAGVVELD